MIGKVIFTNADHAYAERRIFPALTVPGAQTLCVSSAPVNGFCQFGVAITPSSCYELSLMDPDARHEFLTHIYGKEGLGLSLARLCIGSSDYSPELYSYDDVADDIELKHFSVKRDEAYIIPIIKEILAINPDLTLFASPWSPPFWMKTGGSMCGGYMREAFLDCYAEYIIRFIEAYAAYGIRISAITPQNEPNTQQRNCMAACSWHPETEAKFIKILKNRFAERHMAVEIWLYDYEFADVQRVNWMLENCDGLAQDCDGIAFHYYVGDFEQTKFLKEKYPDLDLHFTEGGPRMNDHYDTDWCKWGLMAVKALNAGYATFCGWNLMLDECGGPHIGPFMGVCAGLATYNNVTKALTYSGQYKAFMHVVPYLTADCDVYPICVQDYFSFDMSAYPRFNHEIQGALIDRKDGTKVAVLVNPNPRSLQTQLLLDGQSWYIDLPADSISTVILES